MSKRRIRQASFERCLLTEIAPYETPIVFSNWGSYNFYRHLAKRRNSPAFVQALFDASKLSWSTPYKFRIKKDATSSRTLFLVHPKHSQEIVSFYQRYSVFILRSCKRSRFSIRAPHHVAKFYTTREAAIPTNRQIEDISVEMAYASSFFTYSRYSHLHKFFDSDDFTELEKRYTNLIHLDITKFFASLYTHSVSWAVRGKMQAKSELRRGKNEEPTFDAKFDKLLQSMNAGETNGIPIGPELSRIFAEIILQRVDSTVAKQMEGHGHKFGQQYWCGRYIDDYFLFYNDENAQECFNRVLSEELEKFRLYLGKDKIEKSTRPFITDVSIRKIAISKFLNELFPELGRAKATSSQKFVNHFRALIRAQGTDFYKVSAFFLAAIINKIDCLNSENASFFDELYILLDLAFYAFRMDVRVATCYRIAAIVIRTQRLKPKLEIHSWHKVFDKMVFELRGAIESAIALGNVVECVNLIIISTELDGGGILPLSVIEQAIEKFKEVHNDEYSPEPQRLGYFEIVSLLYVVGRHPSGNTILDKLVATALSILTEHDPRHFSESMYLLVDLVACPYLSNNDKDRLISAAVRHTKDTYTRAQITEIRSFLDSKKWYFHWNENRDLETHLKKKDLLLSY